MILHVVELSIENKMSDVKKLYNSLNIVGSVVAAVSLPWIFLRICTAIYLQKGFKNLKDKVGFPQTIFVSDLFVFRL